MDNLIVQQIEKEAARINTQNMKLVQMLEEQFELQGLVFMDMVQESELPQDNMNYIIVENGDYTNTTPEQKTFTETVTVTFWNENRPNPTLDRLMLLYIAKQCKLRVVSSNNENIILTNTNRIINMFTLTLSRGVKVAGLC